MSFTTRFFRAIDKAFDPKQNPKKMEKELCDVQCVSDVAYSEQYPDMLLDLYFLPQLSKSYPVIFEIHGGGFAAGDKKYRRCLCKHLAKHTGAMVVNVNYGLGAKCACPLPMQQLVAAVNWVGKNAQQYGMDLSQFVVTGDSAGAYYACFLATLQNSDYLQQLFECKAEVKITATVLNCGVYDFDFAMRHKMILNSGICKEFTGLSVKQAKQSRYYNGISLARHVTKDFPKTLLIFAKKDVVVKGQGEHLLAALEQQGADVQHFCSHTFAANHVFPLMWKGKDAKQANAKILEFLKEHFQKLSCKM